MLNEKWTLLAELFAFLPNTQAGGHANWFFSGGPQWSVRENVSFCALVGSAAGHKSNAYVLSRELPGSSALHAGYKNEPILGCAYDFNPPLRAEVDFQSGAEDSSTIGFTCNITRFSDESRLVR